MSVPQNICGLPVKGDNFFDRTEVVARAWERLETDHLLLAAPRRVGKTSLMHKLAGDARARGWRAGVYVSAQSVEDERAFVAKIYAAVARAPECEAVAAHLGKGQFKAALKGVSTVSVGPLAVALRDAAPDNWMVLGEDLAAALTFLPPGKKLLILVDELPVFLLKLLAEDRQRATDFLGWFRELRQGPAERTNDVRWLIAGSIGLGPLARRERWSAQINDLLPLELGAFAPEVAADFLQQVASGYAITLSPETVRAILDEVGWYIPFYLHLFISGLRDLPDRSPTPAHVATVRAALLGPGSSKHFAPWWERLEDELGPVDAAAARAILAPCAVDPDGAPLDTIRAALTGYYTDLDREERRRGLLDVLEGDGYLVPVGDRWRFRSPLLRRVWAARSAR